jgi:type I restriction enzyme S subunit
MVVEKGYKLTEVGVIPEDWDCFNVKQLIDLLTDYDANGSFESVATNVNVYNYENFAWYVRSTDLENKSSLNQVKYVVEISYKFLKKTSLKGGELLFLKRGDIGNVYLFEMRTEKATLAPNLYLLKLNNVSNPRFLFYYFSSDFGQRQLKSKNASSTLGALYKDDVKSIIVPLPPLHEQTSIANALSDMDALIAQTEKLIEKKKAIKQGVMQELLKPKEGWVTKKLGEVCDVRDGTHDSPQYIDNGVPFVTSKNIINGKLDFTEISYISEEDAVHINKRSKVEMGDILMSMIGTIGNAVLVDFNPNFCIKNVALLKPRKINPSYLLQLIYSSSFQAYIESKVDGGIQKFISLGVLRELDIHQPSPEEEARIAIFFLDIDSEIRRTETKLQKLKNQKQGMMQALLTGKIRLV